MVMLSGMRRSVRRGNAVGQAMPAFERVGRDLAFTLQGERVRALHDGALWIEDHRALVVSDLHLEKGSSYARSGQLLPPYDTRATLTRVEALCARLTPSLVVSLGDSFHDGGAVARMDSEDLARLQALCGGHRFVWIAGNHDPETPACLAGERLETITLGALVLRHEPSEGAAPGEVAGHLHPAARVIGGVRSVRARCFATDGARLVMPAFGSYTGGLDLSDEAYRPLFPKGAAALMLGRDALHPVGPDRLAG